MLYFLLFLPALVTGEDCLGRDYGHGSTVCVCNLNHCDTVPRPEPPEPFQFISYTSNQAGLRFDKKVGDFEEANTTDNVIHINADQKFQSVLGWGGAFTDSTGININSIDEALQETLLSSYFSDHGIEYSLCRVPIGGTDFSTRAYSYDDGALDTNLTNFALVEEDYLYKIPLIKKALRLSGNTLQLFASAWTAPKWLKTNEEYAGYGFVKPELYQTWADYFVKFLDAYRSNGIEFWGITTGNEPSIVWLIGNKINSVGWVSSDLGRWILNNLGPTIRGSNHSNINIMILDDQRLFLPWFVENALGDNATRSYIDGIAVHWYLNFATPASLLTDTHELFPEKFLLGTEACNTPQLGGTPVILGSWERGEAYSVDIIEDLLNWVTGWTDWNMVLDLNGGPTYIDNFVDSPIIVNATAGEFYKQPMFYHLGHFSKFVPKGSVRIDTSSDIEEDVMVVAFSRSDNATVVVILNRSQEVVSVDLADENRGNAKLQLSEKSITTILYW